MSVLDEAFGIKEYMVEQRNYFHSHPELAHKEFNTCNHIEEELQKIGIKSRRVAGTNVIAEFEGSGKTLLLRADIDALPIQEKMMFLTKV